MGLRLLVPVALVAALLGGAGRADASTSGLVISQVYGGGGSAAPTYNEDYVELFNASRSSISLSGLSVQYASDTGTTWSVTTLPIASVAAGQYFLVGEGTGPNGISLPTVDAPGAIPMSATTGKVALVNSTTALTGSGCPFDASVIDFVGYGSTANCSEGATTPAPDLTPTTAALRVSGGCTDSDDNTADFVSDAPNPRNTSSSLNVCNKAPVLDPIGNKTVQQGDTLLFTTTATDADSDPLTYSVTNKPSGATYDTSTGTFSWTPLDADIGDHTNIQFTVSDGTASDSETISITVTASPRTTQTDVHVQRSGSDLIAYGDVRPFHEGASVTVSLYRKRHHRFRKIETQTVPLDSSSEYLADFLDAPARGTCKVKVTFPGDPLHDPSSATMKFLCGSP